MCGNGHQYCQMADDTSCKILCPYKMRSLSCDGADGRCHTLPTQAQERNVICLTVSANSQDLKYQRAVNIAPGDS